MTMPSITELSLPHLAMEEPAFAENPLPQFAAARNQHPWLAKWSFGYVVHAYGAAQDLLLMDSHMGPANDSIVEVMKAKDTSWGRFIEEHILNHRGASHKRLRDIVAPMFTPRIANQSRALMRSVITTLLDEWAPKGGFDFEQFASNFPITVMCSLVGAPIDALPRLRSSLEALGLAFIMDPRYLPSLDQGMIVMDTFVYQLMNERRANRRPTGEPDLLDMLLEATARGDLTDREVADLLVFLFVAGYDTSKNVLTLMMHTMLSRPADYARCAEDFSFCSKVVEESLRFHNPATIPRLVTAEFTYRDVVLPKGTMLFFPVSVLGHDPTAFPDPENFDPERPNASRHLAFGRGGHMCLGQFIARAQIQEGWHLIAQRITKPRLAGTVGWRAFPGVWGIRGLPITFEPAPNIPIRRSA
jgi:cytochrome P450